MNKSLQTALLCSIVLSIGSPVSARNQWDTNHGGTQQQVIDPRLVPGGAWSGYVKPAANPGNIWQGQNALPGPLGRRVPAGTVLTAILEDDLHSGKSLKGDTFALTLQDGFLLNGNVIVPPNSKVIGTVLSAISAKQQRSGMAGALEVSLQSLVFPDGQHMPIYAVIDANPNHAFKKAAAMRNAGLSLKDYGSSVSSMMLSFVSGPGYIQKKINAGNEFELDKGEAVPLRLTRSIDVPEIAGTGSAQNFTGATSSAQLPYPPGTAPAAAAPAAVPGLVDPQGPYQIPGMVPVQQGAPSYGGMPPQAPPAYGQQDPNVVFQKPIGAPTLNDLPDPF